MVKFSLFIKTLLKKKELVCYIEHYLLLKKNQRKKEEEKRRRQKEEEELRNKIKNVSEYDYYDPPAHRNNNFDRIFSSMNNVSFPIYRREFGGGSGTFSVNVGCNII